MTSPFRIYIGWDSREPEAYDVARFSLLRRASIPVEVHPIKVDDLIARGWYTRAKDPLASTEFTYSRFLTPALAGFKGWALFCDSDFLWLHDIAGLAQYAQGSKAVQCVQHDYTPKETTKMDGAVQTAYPRKNWSSLMLFNCEHPSVVKNLTPEIVNRESGAYLHRMQWAADEDIGALPVIWNWLEGWNEKPKQGTPGAVHFTRGGPWFENWQNVDYGDLWLAERALMERDMPYREAPGLVPAASNAATVRA
ncbi:MAG TPA: glycosyltransferase [Pseudorhodoplanes sp.]|nr:glycosyltransferase [Pseudorhodoplanes sp.]